MTPVKSSLYQIIFKGTLVLEMLEFIIISYQVLFKNIYITHIMSKINGNLTTKLMLKAKSTCYNLHVHSFL